jgi:hypothetical protein
MVLGRMQPPVHLLHHPHCRFHLHQTCNTSPPSSSSSFLAAAALFPSPFPSLPISPPLPPLSSHSPTPNSITDPSIITPTLTRTSPHSASHLANGVHHQRHLSTHPSIHPSSHHRRKKISTRLAVSPLGSGFGYIERRGTVWDEAGVCSLLPILACQKQPEGPPPPPFVWGSILTFAWTAATR